MKGSEDVLCVHHRELIRLKKMNAIQIVKVFHESKYEKPPVKVVTFIERLFPRAQVGVL
jgi:hypothetical protein